jgi:hypothetical protein
MNCPEIHWNLLELDWRAPLLFSAFEILEPPSLLLLPLLLPHLLVHQLRMGLLHLRLIHLRLLHPAVCSIDQVLPLPTTPEPCPISRTSSDEQQSKTVEYTALTFADRCSG